MNIEQYRTIDFFFKTSEIKDFVMDDGQNFYDNRVKNYLRTYCNIKKIVTGQGDDYKTDCFLID